MIMTPTAFFSRRTRTRSAFTLVELLTVIAIIGILAAILIPVVGRVRESARQNQCLSQVRQLALAARMYAQDNKNMLPPAMVDSAGGATTWYQSIAGYLSIDPSLLGAAPKLRAVGIQICPTFEPSTNRATSYGLNNYMFKGMSYSHRWSYSIPVVPSPSRIFMIGEKNGNVEQVADTGGAVPEYRHSQGGNWAFVDGHVEYIKAPVASSDPRWKWW
jgi:general secretion pathway protein G